MIGALHSLKFAELSHYDGETIKGYVTGLQRNRAGLYWFDIAAVRAPQHNHIDHLLRERSREVAFIGRSGVVGSGVVVRFEAEPRKVFQIEMHSYDGKVPSRQKSEELADALWYATNQSLDLDTNYMVAKLFVHSDDIPQPTNPNRQWARQASDCARVEPVSFDMVVRRYLS